MSNSSIGRIETTGDDRRTTDGYMSLPGYGQADINNLNRASILTQIFERKIASTEDQN